VLEVQDNAPNFPETFNLDTVDSVGFQILQALGEYELDGTLEMESDPRTTVRLTFQLVEPDQAEFKT